MSMDKEVRDIINAGIKILRLAMNYDYANDTVNNMATERRELEKEVGKLQAEISQEKKTVQLEFTDLVKDAEEEKAKCCKAEPGGLQDMHEKCDEIRESCDYQTICHQKEISDE